MATVVVKNGNVDGALKTLKQKNAKGVKRRLAKKEAIKNSRKNNRNNY